MKRICISAFISIAGNIFLPNLNAQTQQLDLFKCIGIASDSSLQAFRARNMYLSSYWEYRSFKAARLPAVSLRMTPVQYNRNITKRYNYNENIEAYRTQQSLNMSGSLSISQNFDLTGGTFILDSDLGYMRNYGENTFIQFSSVPFRLGYSQSLFGFNSFKWEKKIEPLKFEKAKKQFTYQYEEIAENTVLYFFDYILAEKEYEMALENILATDTLYNIGLDRRKISAISQVDILTLELDIINADNTLKSAKWNLKASKKTLAIYLNLEGDFDLSIPEIPRKINIQEEDALSYAKEYNPDYVQYRQEIWEAEREVDRTKKTTLFDASVSASIGFNQAADNFSGAYRKPLQQDIMSVSLTIPILDWGIRKGKANIAKNNLNIVKVSILQNEQNLEQEIILAIDNFNIQQDLIDSSKKALSLSKSAYQITKDRFAIGKSDLSSLTLSLSRYKEAQRNYLSALKNYWISYFKIRKLTLYDFEKNRPIDVEIDKKLEF
ncbi:TolC family protein [Bacteroidaceae bacterium HV4-6-C5C]|nr:TolC family protein [Bacteroidaceae bacterium HV4-6-C5C]